METKLSPIALALIISLTIPSSADTQTWNSPNIDDGIFAFFETQFGDGRSNAILNQIFGPLYDTADGGAQSTSFSVLIGMINLLVLSVGGIMLAYNITAGLLQSAHEGQILGRRWSSLWAPLRVLFAVALLIPAPGLGGYNVMQATVAWITRGSTLMASELWSYGSSAILTGEIPITGVTPRLDSELIGAVYRNQLCFWLANYQFEIAESDARVEFVVNPKVDPLLIISSVNGTRNEICGSYRLPETPAYISRLGIDAPIVERQFRQIHSEILQRLIQDIDNIIALQWPVLIANKGELQSVTEWIESAVNNANSQLLSENTKLLKDVSNSVNQSNDARQELLERIANPTCGNEGLSGDPAVCGSSGWIGAGSWHITIARLNAEIMGLLNARPTAKESRYLTEGWSRLNRQVVLAVDNPSWIQRILNPANGSKYLHIQEAERIWQAANSHFEQSAASLNEFNVRISGKLLEDTLPVGRSGLLGRVWEIGFADAVDAMIETFSPSNWADDPIVGVARMGNWYLDIAGALIFGGAAASLLSNGFGSAVVFIIAAPLTAIGVMQSFILPMVPFIYWVLAVAGYFLLVIEAVVAASLWAVAHMRLDGEGISGGAGSYGWLILLSLILTPSLMILGYFASMILFRVTARLFDAGMYYAMFALANASPIVAVFGLIASGFLIVLAYMVILQQSFSLVSMFPSRILRWIGSEANLSDGVSEGRIHGVLQSASSSVGSGFVKVGQVANQGLSSFGFGKNSR